MATILPDPILGKTASMNISVVIPSYRRPKDLARCLEAIQNQIRPADEVVVIFRDTDPETEALLTNFNLELLPLHTVKLPDAGGIVAALNAGLEKAQGDIIAITDDDAAPHVDWLANIETHYLADSSVGGVGGRDTEHYGTKKIEGATEVVGVIQWFGRVIGDHHIGVGEPREVDVLKGVNMSYRRSAIANLRFDQRLLGRGAQPHNELAFCLALKRAGWKLIYDPKIAVEHYLGQRFDEDQRIKFHESAFFNIVHNETLILLEYLPPARRIVFLLWAILVGTRSTWGVVQWLRFLPSEGTVAGQKLLVSLRGRWQGLRTWQQWNRTLTNLPTTSSASGDA